MNILPKKKWHVRTKENIERVRRDEAQAEEERQKEEKRKALAESEARTDLLRSRAAISSGQQKEVQLVSSSSGHINFFIDADRTAKSVNKEAEEEKRLEKEKQEKAIGLLTYLGQSSTEALDSKPWYVKAPEKKKKCKDEEQQSSSGSRKKGEYNIKAKRAQDPLLLMTAHMEQAEKYHKQSKPEELSAKSKVSDGRDRSRATTTAASTSSSLLAASASTSKGPKTMAELRAERMRREQEERRKAEQLMARVRGDVTHTDKQEVITDERRMSYNSRFNPDFVRKRPLRYDDDIS